ncbi:hypothetical protein GA0115234_108815 [Streptomyces sp. DvalAA-43]|jgi:hypothetical protein|nr:hypothetical protein GA0115234_108815 [Streptomyces sp. DvalAA-43]
MKAAVVNLRYQGIAIAAGLCRALAGMPLPRAADGRIVLARNRTTAVVNPSCGSLPPRSLGFGPRTITSS